MNDPSYITLAEAAGRFHVSASHLRMLARRGRITARKLGRDWLTTESAVREYLAHETARSRIPGGTSDETHEMPRTDALPVPAHRPRSVPRKERVEV